MFVSIGILFMICGALLLRKAKKTPKEQGLHLIFGGCGMILLILGVLLVCGLLSGKIPVPLG